jgi:hypothetical protein
MNRNVGVSSADRSPPAAAQQDFGMASEGEGLTGTPKEYSGWDVYKNEAKRVDTELVKD